MNKDSGIWAKVTKGARMKKPTSITQPIPRSLVHSISRHSDLASHSWGSTDLTCFTGTWELLSGSGMDLPFFPGLWHQGNRAVPSPFQACSPALWRALLSLCHSHSCCPGVQMEAVPTSGGVGLVKKSFLQDRKCLPITARNIWGKGGVVHCHPCSGWVGDAAPCWGGQRRGEQGVGWVMPSGLSVGSFVGLASGRH